MKFIAKGISALFCNIYGLNSMVADEFWDDLKIGKA